MKNLKTTLFAMMALAATMASAQVSIKTAAGDLNFRITGRINLDAGQYLGGDGINLNDGTGKKFNNVQLHDTRIGYTATLADKWTARMEVNINPSSIVFRDVWLKYKFTETSDVQVGNFFMPFGYLQLGTQWRFAANGMTDGAFSSARRFGAAYNYNTDQFKLIAGMWSDGATGVSQLGNQGISLSAKAFYRPIINDMQVLHVAFCPQYTHSDNSVTLNGKVPVTMNNRSVVSLSTTYDNKFQYEVEVLYINKKFYGEVRFQGETIHVDNEAGDNLNATGVWAQAGYLLIGDQQKYNKTAGYAALPSPKSLELLARVEYLKIDDLSGSAYTIGLNYYFNKWIRARGNFVWGGAKDGDNFVAMQARLQFSL